MKMDGWDLCYVTEKIIARSGIRISKHISITCRFTINSGGRSGGGYIHPISACDGCAIWSVNRLKFTNNCEWMLLMIYWCPISRVGNVDGANLVELVAGQTQGRI